MSKLLPPLPSAVDGQPSGEAALRTAVRRPWRIARVGGPRRRPDCLYADRGYGHDTYRRLIRAKGVKHRIGRRGVEHGSGLGKHRYVVERTIALLHWGRRLRIRWEIRDDIHEALLSLAAALICWRRLTL